MSKWAEIDIDTLILWEIIKFGTRKRLWTRSSAGINQHSSTHSKKAMPVYARVKVLAGSCSFPLWLISAQSLLEHAFGPSFLKHYFYRSLACSWTAACSTPFRIRSAFLQQKAQGLFSFFHFFNVLLKTKAVVFFFFLNSNFMHIILDSSLWSWWKLTFLFFVILSLDSP